MVFTHETLPSDRCSKVTFVIGVIALFSVLAPSHLANGQPIEPPHPDSLIIASFDDLLAAVESHNYGIQSARTRSDLIQAEVDVQGTLPDPTIAIGVFPMPIHTARGEQVLQLRVEQMLPWPGKRRIQHEMAAWEAAMGKEEAIRLRAEAMLDAVHAAVAIERSEQLMVTTEAFRERLKRFEDIALSRYETGQGAQQNVWKLQLAVAAQDQALNRLREQRQTAVAWLGERIHRPMTILEGAFADNAPPVANTSINDRSEIRHLDAGLEKARLARKMAELAKRPDIGVSATWMAITQSAIPASSDGRDALGIGVMVRIPLGRAEQNAREEMARLQVLELEASRQNFVATWESMWHEQAVHLDAQLKQLRHLEQNLIPLAEAMLESSMQAYASGRAGFLDLLDAERSAFELRQQRIELSTRLSMTQWARVRLSGQWDVLPFSDVSR